MEIGDLIMLFGLSFFLLSNVFRMYYFMIGKSGLKVPLSLYVTEAWQLAYHAVTQIRFSQCDEDQPGFLHKDRWRNHWLLVSGYALMFTMIVLFLKWFQTDSIYPLWHPQS